MRPPAANPSTRFDVAVAGGGPAGAALATFLARQGHRCVIFEPLQFPRYHVGESLIPGSYGILGRLGVLPKLQSAAFPQKRSVRFISETGNESAPFYFTETISGEGAVTWQVERSEFDRILLDHARENGVEVQAMKHVRSILFENGCATGVIAADDAGVDTKVRAKVVVDASGRACVIGNQLGLKVDVPGLYNAALWGYFRGGQRLPGIDSGETTIFRTAGGGWFWYIPLPEDLVSVGVVASPDYLFDEAPEFEPVFLREVARCRPLGQRLEQAERTQPVRGIRRLAYRNRQIVGNGWVMVGDAAAFLDPIYSSGVFLALASAELAAQCIHAGLEAGDLSANRLGTFVEPLTRGVRVIRQLVGAFYDPSFSFRKFLERFPQERAALIDCLVGNVIDTDMRSIQSALATMTPPPEW